jgi:hypothetical protein
MVAAGLVEQLDQSHPRARGHGVTKPLAHLFQVLAAFGAEVDIRGFRVLGVVPSSS